MILRLLLICLLVSSFSYSQYNQSSPWMTKLKKEKNTNTSKNANSSFTIEEITKSFDEYWRENDKTVKGSGYKPYMRWRNYWMNFVDKNGHIPSSKQLWDAWKTKEDRIGMVTNPTSNWTSVGPTTHGVFQGQLPGTGRINAITVDPNNPNTWYAGAPAGGIWKSTNAGSSWTNLFSNFPQIGVSGIAVDANNSNIIYISTGDDDAADSYSIGVYKSLDGGATWNETGLNPNTSGLGNSFLTNEITIDPTNSNIIYLGSSNGLYKSIDAGVTWLIKQAGNITDFKLKPEDSSTIYAVSSNTYYKSTDSGETFSSITSNLPTTSGRLALGVSVANPNIVYVLSAKSGADDYSYGGLYLSTDSGTTFTKTANTVDIFEANQAWYDLAIEVSPTDANTIFIGSLNIWKSTNGGISFSQVNSWSQNNASYTHADIHTLKFFNGILFCGSDGGLYTSNNNGTTFQDVTKGMSIGQFYRISVAEDDASKMIGGLQDNGGNVLSNNQWNNYHGGDGMDNVIDPNNNNLIYGFTQNGGSLNISTNSGQNIGQIGPPKNSADENIEGNWITPLAISSTGDVYAGFDALYKLEGSSWVKKSNAVGDGNIDDLEIDPNNPNIIYAVNNRSIFKSIDGGVTFTNHISLSSIISDLAINASDSNIIYVTTSNRIGTPHRNQPSSRGVFKITTNGATVTQENITFNLPTEQTYFSIAHQVFHEDNPIFVGTSLGVYRLDDTLTEWEDYFTDLPSVAIGDIDINTTDNIITAATYGRGVWQSPIPLKIAQNDVGIVSIKPKNNTIICGQLNTEVIIKNNGTNTISEISFNFNFENDTPTNFIWTGTLNSNQETTVQLPALTASSFGTLTYIVEANLTNDTFNNNNTKSALVHINKSSSGGEINTFENATDALITYNESGATALWKQGVPTGTVLNTAGSGTQVYGTNLAGDHPSNTKAYLVSRCYELSAITNPILKFKMAYELEENWDITYVEYSINQGVDWSVLGNINSKPNWYNSDRTNTSSGAADDCQNCPGAQWTGTSTALKEYSYNFTTNAAAGETNLTSESNIIFRIVFHSDPNTVEEGVIIDDFGVDGLQDDDDDDNDGILDINDNCPLTANADQLDTDNDGIGDVCDTDDDGDGVLDASDNCPLTANADQADADNDGIGDVCDNDSDNDGVPNASDTCPNTPLNAVVDINGCKTFSLPATNFRVLSTGESCISSNNGTIKISATETLNYTAVLSGTANNSQSFTDNVTFNNLAFGTYKVCITVEGQTGYESCFNISITEPEPLAVSSKVNSLANKVTFNLSGSNNYTITINEKIYHTSANEVTLPLDQIENNIRIKTDKDCQGVYEETIISSSEIFIYPNPVSSGDLTIQLGHSDLKNVEIALFTMDGSRVYRKKYPTTNGSVTFNVDALSKGIYLLNIKTNKTLLTYKIIRK